MNDLSAAQALRRERTLLLAIGLSAFGPFATGYAVVLSQSTTQLADFVRRTAELGAMIVSWAMFRRLTRGSGGPAYRSRLSRIANTSVAAAMATSGVILTLLALVRLGRWSPGGNVYPGLAVAVLGLGVNTWFWRRYANMPREHYEPIIATQTRLYLGKAAVDLCVVGALAAVALAPAHPATRVIDVAGSIAVGAYLAWCAARTMRSL